MTQEQISTLLLEAANDILQVDTVFSLDQVRSKYLGKKGLITELLQRVCDLPKEERRDFGSRINIAKEKLQDLLQKQAEKIEAQKIAASLAAKNIDVTLPSRGRGLGSLHPITKVRRKIEDFFLGMGFAICEGPEIEDDYHNFTALNVPENHPARHMQDTFYFPNGLLLRTHTSPVQIRAMKNGRPPFQIIAPGRVYRCDSDATHSPMFNQIEGLVVAEGINFANLKWLLSKFLKDFFGESVEFRFRPSYFPFTEPSAEVDIKWANSNGQSRWLEVLGCGMVHPNVLAAVGVDSEIYSGFAFGLGVDRFAMLRYGIDDLRLFFENDVKFLEQF